MSQMRDWVSEFQGQLPDFLANLFKPQGQWRPNAPADAGIDLTTPIPDADVFNTPEAYIVHVSLPGAKKTDLDVSFDAATNVVKISGLLHRPDEVDEKMLAGPGQRERRVGFFEKLVLLDRDARVDPDDLGARLEDGVLRLEIPKLDPDEWTEVRKVQIE